MTEYAARAAFHELLDLLRDADKTFVEGDREVADEVSAAEGYRYLTDALHAALEIYLRSDADRPAFVPIVGPTFKWGGDNSDAFYNFAPVSPDREYLIRAKRGDACYLSVCVYSGLDDGRWSTGIVSNLNDRDIDFDADGSFEISVARERPANARNWPPLADGANAMVTRDYHVDPVNGAPTVYSIETVPSLPPPAPLGDAEVAGRLRAVTNFLRELFAITPFSQPSAPNTIADVWAVPDATYGWAAKDADYAMGTFELADDEQLVVEGRSPACAYWGLHALEPVHAGRSTTGTSASASTASRQPTSPTVRGGSWSRPAIPDARTGCRRPGTAPACCSSAGSSPRRLPRPRPPESSPSDRFVMRL